ncbi:MAG TPA: hypothetical protein VGB13_04630 [Candidatus Krumholzibacteria bacterium]
MFWFKEENLVPIIGVRGNLVVLEIVSSVGQSVRFSMTVEQARLVAKLICQQADIIDPPKAEEAP